MAAPAKSGAFLDNLGKIYFLYTGGFFVFVVVLAILEQMGVPNVYIGYGFVFLTILVYAVIGVLSRTAEAGEYYVAGRSVPAFYNGMATGADWMSAASFVGMAGSLFLLGYDGLAFVLGWTGGYVLVAILIAPFLRKFGAYTVPDFFAARYEGNFPRFLAVIVLIACSFTYVVAQIFGTGLIAQRFLGMDFVVAVYVGLIGILLCSMLGGMKAVTWTQVAQYIVLIVAYLTPVVILSAKKYGLPIPQLTYGQAISDIGVLEKKMIADGLASAATLKPHATPFINYSPLNYFALILCLMVGTASLPHVLMRYFTTPSVREARNSVAWSLFFIFLLYFTAPAYAAFSKLEVYNLIAAKTELTEAAGVDLHLRQARSRHDLRQGCCDGARRRSAACGAIANHPGLLRHQDLGINPDAIVLSTPEIAGMPYVIAGLVAAGGLAAALSTADGLLLAIANALSHDIYYKMINPNAPTATPSRRLARSARGRGAGCSLDRLDTAIRYSRDGVVGVLAGGCRYLPGACARRLVEAGEQGWRNCRYDRRLRPVPVLPRRLPVLPWLRREVLRHVVVAEPGHRRAARSIWRRRWRPRTPWKAGSPWRIRWPRRSAG